MENLVFDSRIDYWYFLVTIIAIAALCFCFYVIPRVSKNQIRSTSYVLFLITILPMMVLPIWLALTTKYSFSENLLSIRSGPFSWEVNIESIESVSSSNSLRASPALSLDRLRIVYDDDKSVMVSPSDKNAFILELTRRGVDVNN